jgi:hypothetical protein
MNKYNSEQKILNLLLNGLMLFISFSIAITVVHTVPLVILVTCINLGVFLTIIMITDKLFTTPVKRNEMIIEVMNNGNLKFSGESANGMRINLTLVSHCFEGYHFIRVWERSDFDYKYGISYKNKKDAKATLVEVADYLESTVGLDSDLFINTWEEFFGEI